jgi:hypothetical protein
MLEDDPYAEICVRALRACHDICLRAATVDRLMISGLPVPANHIRSMLDCAEICQVAANFLVRDSDNYVRICYEAAVICRELASMSEKFDNNMNVVAACNACASACDDLKI